MFCHGIKKKFLGIRNRPSFYGISQSNLKEAVRTTSFLIAIFVKFLVLKSKHDVERSIRILSSISFAFFYLLRPIVFYSESKVF